MSLWQTRRVDVASATDGVLGRQISSMSLRKYVWFGMAAILAVVVIGVLVFATHSATPAAKAAVALPHCTKIKKADGQSDQQDSAVRRNGILAQCGPGWAAFKVAGSWHLIPAGHCTYGFAAPTTNFYSGLWTALRVPHVGLHLHTKEKDRNPTPGREYRITGNVELVPGTREHLAGSVSWNKYEEATFSVRGSRTHHVYAGVMSCFDPTS
jgi:hypothetical protein